LIAEFEKCCFLELRKRNLKRRKQIIGKNFEGKKICVILVNQLNGLKNNFKIFPFFRQINIRNK